MWKWKWKGCRAGEYEVRWRVCAVIKFRGSTIYKKGRRDTDISFETIDSRPLPILLVLDLQTITIYFQEAASILLKSQSCVVVC